MGTIVVSTRMGTLFAGGLRDPILDFCMVNAQVLLPYDRDRTKRIGNKERKKRNGERVYLRYLWKRRCGENVNGCSV